MFYRVKPGDSLSAISKRLLYSEQRWMEIALLNGLRNPDHLLVGQQLNIPPASAAGHRPSEPSVQAQRVAAVPANYYLFVLADEVNPLRGKVVRRVLVNPNMSAAAAARLGRPLPMFPHPERFGFTPGASKSPLPLGRHAMGMKPSPLLSASRWPLGATRFKGTPFWIDEARAKASGATFHEVDEIVTDLERIAAKTRDATSQARIRDIIGKVRADREVLIRGSVPASAVKGPLAMGATRALQGVQIVGFAVTAIDMTRAAQASRDRRSIKPLAAETIRQAGGWAAAWAGMKVGAAGGALVGIETGPGAIATGAIGGVLGGIGGYYGFDWIADHIDEN